MRLPLVAALVSTVACLSAFPTLAQSTWTGAASADPADSANWAPSVPGPADIAVIGSAPQSPDFAGQLLTWAKLNLFVANHIANTGGGGQLYLVGADNSQFFSAGDDQASIIDVDVIATKNIQTNGSHSVIFNGEVTAAKIEAFGRSTATLNGVTRQTDQFMSIGGGSKIVINNEFYWGHNGHGINNSPVLELGAGARFFRPDGAGGWAEGLDVFNVYDGAVVRLLADNALGTHGETDIWTRNTTNTFDLNGHDQFVEFFGMGDAPAALNIDFGAVSGPNKLIWDAAAGLNGPGGFNVLNFQPGLDTLELGQYGDHNGFHNPAVLGRIKINGAAYADSNPGPGVAWWTAVPTPDANDDPLRRIAVYHHGVPEPAGVTLGLLAAALLASGARRKG